MPTLAFSVRVSAWVWGSLSEKLALLLATFSRELRHRGEAWHRRGRNARHLRLREIRNGRNRDLRNLRQLGNLRQTGRRERRRRRRGRRGRGRRARVGTRFGRRRAVASACRRSTCSRRGRLGRRRRVDRFAGRARSGLRAVQSRPHAGRTATRGDRPSGGASRGRGAAGAGASCRLEGGHRLGVAVLPIQGEVVARQDDPVEGDDEPDCRSSGAENEPRLRQLRSWTGRCGLRAARCHVPARS
jgi:hypothetical protein